MEKKTENNGASTPSNQELSKQLSRLLSKPHPSSIEEKTENNGASTLRIQELPKSLPVKRDREWENTNNITKKHIRKVHKYVISAHGWYPVKNGKHSAQIETLEYNCAVYFYCKYGDQFSCHNVFQTSLCRNFKYDDTYYGEVKACEVVYQTGHIDFNYLFESDANGHFHAGIVNCTTGQVIYNLKHKKPQDLRTLLTIIDTNNTQFHSGRFYEVHILSCRSFVDYKFKQKYLKYKQKYLALKNQHIKTQVNYSIQ